MLMARIAGIELQDNWKVDYALTKIRGIGWPLSKNILSVTGVSINKRISELTPEEIAKITNKLEEFPTEGELARSVRSNISRLQAIGSYRGIRHSRNLPVRGQRTRTNARTKRGKRKTVGAFKKETLSTIKTAKEEKEKGK
jgi:small subunit ribosomal protein S13